MKKTNQEEILIRTLKILKDLGVEYFVVGGLAVSVWGRPRATFDIDLVIKLKKDDVDSFIGALKAIFEKGNITKDTVKEAIDKEGEFNFIDPQTGIKVDFWVGGKIGPPEFERKKVKKINGQKIYFISPEDLILNKLKWYKKTESEKHLKDVRSVVKISKEEIDKKYLKKWARKLEIIDFLEKII